MAAKTVTSKQTETSHQNAMEAALPAIKSKNSTPTREVKRKISRATFNLLASIFLCSLILIVDQFKRLGSIGLNNDDHTNEIPEKIHSDHSKRYRVRQKMQGAKLGWSLPREGAKLSSEEFMASLQNRQLQSNLAQLNQSGSDDRLPTPIFVLNLPKSGTETSRDYFSCGGYESSHTYVGTRRIGSCLFDNWKKENSVINTKSGQNYNFSPLSGCDTVNKTFYINRTDPLYGKNVTVQVYSDIGKPLPTCYYPTLHDGGLNHLYSHYPNATWVLFVRNEYDWLDSMKRWNNGLLLKKWKNACGFPGGTATDKDWFNFYSKHTEKIRQFVSHHSSLNYIEVELEKAHESLSKYTGIESRCLRHCLPGRKDDEKCVQIGEKHVDRNQKSTEILQGVMNLTKIKMGNSSYLPWSLPSVPTVRKNSTEFMNHWTGLKHGQGITLPWEEDPSVSGLKLPTPIFILNLPKSGTQTLSEYFKCGEVESSHTYVRLTRTGACLRDNYLLDAWTASKNKMINKGGDSNSTNGVNPFHRCDEVTKLYGIPPVYNKTVTVLTYSDIGVPYPGQCFYSSINDGGLEHLYKYYPNATIMLLTREVNSWYSSIKKWNEGRILKAWRRQCGYHGGLDDGSKQDWVDFYNAHTEKIRNFAEKHLSMTYIEMELEDASFIDYYTGISAKCFQHCQPAKKQHEMCKPLGGFNDSVS